MAGELAAIAAYKILKGGDRVGGLVFKGENYDLFNPQRNRQNVLRFLQKIVEANGEIYNSRKFDFTESFKQVLVRLRNIITHDFMVVVISDFCRYNKEVIRYLSQLSRHNDVVLIKVFDPLEARLPSEHITLSNIDEQIQLEANDNALNKKLAKDQAQNYKEFKSEMEKYGITLFEINTEDPLEEQLIELFTRQKTR